MSQNRNSKRLWIWMASVVLFLLSAIVLLHFMLPLLLEKVLERKLQHAEEAYGLQIQVDGMHFSDCSLKGTFVFSADSIRVQRNLPDSDIILVRAPEVRMRAWKGLHKDIVLRTFRADDISMCWGVGADSVPQDSLKPQAKGKKISFERLAGNFSEYCPQRVEVKHLDCRYHSLSLNVRDADFRCQLVGKKGRVQDFHLLSGMRAFQCQHRYMAAQPVEMDSIRMDCLLHVTSHSMEIDSVSAFQCQRLLLHPYLKAEKDKSWHLVFRLDEAVDADSCFSSLPQALFSVLPFLKAKGKINSYCFLDVDFAQLDSLTFDFNLHSGQPAFHIVEGMEQLTRFNDSFEYTFFRNGEAVRTVPIGPENRYFCPFSQIPEELTASILASEDASFFRHRGFVKSSIQSALIDDLKAGYLRRGGSTISMQLVKNLYLNRQKVLTRKLEEMMLVWMIEDYSLLSKERMFEIYVNIIEWGPDIIGIGEAADFYFHKKPSELKLNECVYLATLIRAPRHYASSIQQDGMITEARQTELQFVADRMLERGLMTEAQHASFTPMVQTMVNKNIPLLNPGTDEHKDR